MAVPKFSYFWKSLEPARFEHYAVRKFLEPPALLSGFNRRAGAGCVSGFSTAFPPGYHLNEGIRNNVPEYRPYRRFDVLCVERFSYFLPLRRYLPGEKSEPETIFWSPLFAHHAALFIPNHYCIGLEPRLRPETLVSEPYFVERLFWIGTEYGDFSGLVFNGRGNILPAGSPYFHLPEAFGLAYVCRHNGYGHYHRAYCPNIWFWFFYGEPGIYANFHLFRALFWIYLRVLAGHLH